MTTGSAVRQVYIGTAGWSIPAIVRGDFPEQGSGLERYAARFNAAEINSSFYRPHRRTTYERWAASVPDAFRFAVKLPKTITHQRRLVDCADLIDPFAKEITGLGVKLGAILIQLPPTLALDMPVVRLFLAAMRDATAAPLVCEPRHASWFSPAAEAFLIEHRVARVGADPARFDTAETPGGWPAIAYRRLHGSPHIYYSQYDAAALTRLSAEIDEDAAQMRTSWCIFDNTAAFAATGDALTLRGNVIPSTDQA